LEVYLLRLALLEYIHLYRTQVAKIKCLDASVRAEARAEGDECSGVEEVQAGDTQSVHLSVLLKKSPECMQHAYLDYILADVQNL